MSSAVSLSKDALERYSVLTKLESGQLTLQEAADRLGISTRQLRRLVLAYQCDGVNGLVHGNRGRAPANKLDSEVAATVKRLAADDYRSLDDVSFRRRLADHHGINISAPTVSKLRREVGLVSPRARTPVAEIAEDGASSLWFTSADDSDEEMGIVHAEEPRREMPNRSQTLSEARDGARDFGRTLLSALLRVIDAAGEEQNRLHVALNYVAGLSLAEILTVFWDPRVGVLTHMTLMLLMMIHTERRWNSPDHRLWLSLTVMPLIRIVSLSLPLIDFSLPYWFFYTSIPLFVAAVLSMRLLRLSLKDVGLVAGRLGPQTAIGSIGILLGVTEYYILRPEPLITEFTWSQFWWPALIIMISTGLMEELIFRGIVQKMAIEQLGLLTGVFYVNAYFAVLHLGYRSFLDFVFVFVVGILFSWFAIRTRSIMGVTIAHGLTNIVLFLVMPFIAA